MDGLIKIYLGNVGSGKTASAVREMFINENRKKTYSNIVTKLKNQININPSMIIKQEIVDTKKKRSGELEPVYKYKLNTEFWKSIKEPIDCIIDEAHSIINSRRAMSKINVIVTDWIALIRRVLGSSDEGSLVFISQLERRLDPIARDMATQVRYHLMHYLKTCQECFLQWQEHSEMPETLGICPRCRTNTLLKSNHTVEVWHFTSIQSYQFWKDYGQDSFYKHYFIKDISKYFQYYSTLQWDNLFSEFYT